LFNMFPGMGAYSFLARRLEPLRVEKMILSGRIYSVDELYNLGLIDVVTAEQDGLHGVNNLVKKLKKSNNTQDAVLKMRNIVNPVSYDEMINIGKMWVDSALSLSAKEIKVMRRLISQKH